MQLLAVAGRKIIVPANLVAFPREPVGKSGAEESRGAGDEKIHKTHFRGAEIIAYARRPETADGWYYPSVTKVRQLGRYALRALFILSVLLLLAGSGLQLDGKRERVRRYTRPLEFDFGGWTAKALGVELGQYGLNSQGYLAMESRRQLVFHTLALIEEEARLEGELQDLYGEPELADRALRIEEKREELRGVERRRAQFQPVAETILQEQLAVILADLGLDLGGKPFPPVAFRFSELPYALIVSPRDVIQQDANIQLQTDLSLERRVALEQQVEAGLDVSALVVPVGGYGTYPTMIQQSSSLPWITEVVAHEWIHNYLSLRPLGLRYDESGDLRTMNETTATLMGRALGRLVLARYYPERIPPEPPPEPEARLPEEEPEPQGFDFREEMRRTRVRVDELLANSRIEEAEAFMEARRQVFWENGYRIRRLNQAYFAFHGSYAAEPGGAAGDDPVGEAVRELWAQVDNPVGFLRKMARMKGPEDLSAALGRPIVAP